MRMINYFKKEKVMTIALLLAILSAFIVHPDKQYIRFSLLHFSASLCSSRTLVENNYTLTLSIAQRYFSSNRTAIELA